MQRDQQSEGWKSDESKMLLHFLDVGKSPGRKNLMLHPR